MVKKKDRVARNEFVEKTMKRIIKRDKTVLLRLAKY